MTPASVARALGACVLAAVSIAATAAQAHLGFAVSAETDGFFSTTLKHVKITDVTAGSPAEQAGLAAGDDVESVNDVPIAGTSGSRIMDLVHAVQPGDHLRLKVLRGGTEHLVDIVGGPPK